jgi:ABC-type multidrug transport system ATPase subunit
MMTVAGLLRPASGTIDMLGCGPFDAAVHAGRFALLPQDSELPLEATPMGLFYRFGRLQGLSSDAARRSACDVLKAVNLADRAKSSIRSLSHGMRMRVRLAQCFIGSPEVVLLDEPLNGLDPVEADRVRRFLRERRGRQTIVISSHNLHDIETLCTHVAFVEKGRVTRTSTLEAITRASSRVTYTLAAEPSDMAALSAAVPGATFAWTAETHDLVCTFEAADGDVAAINRKLLPALLAQTDVLAVSSGLSLEQAYLGN